MTHNHYVPRKVWELRKYLIGLYPNDAAKYRRMKARQLWAIFFSLWSKTDCLGCKRR